MSIAAYVMAGGGSRRFGSDKARAEHEGQPLIARNAAILAERYGEVRVVSAPGRDYGDLGLATVFDLHPGQGPLAGLEAALADTEADAIAIAACDLIGLQADWYALLEAAQGAGPVAFRDTRWHPLVAIYPATVLPEIRRRLDVAQLAVRELLDAHGTPVPPPAGWDALVSVNTRESLP